MAAYFFNSNETPLAFLCIINIIIQNAVLVSYRIQIKVVLVLFRQYWDPCEVYGRGAEKIKI